MARAAEIRVRDIEEFRELYQAADAFLTYIPADPMITRPLVDRLRAAVAAVKAKADPEGA